MRDNIEFIKRIFLSRDGLTIPYKSTCTLTGGENEDGKKHTCQKIFWKSSY